MKYRILVQQHMLPIPSGVFILKDYGEFVLHDAFRDAVTGWHLVVHGHPEVLINWLKNFKEVWVSEDENPSKEFYLANIKDQYK